MHYIIYKIINKLNNKIYIGKHITTNINDGYMGSGTYIKKAYKKYGKENFTKEIIEETDKDKLNDREKYWIKYYNSNKSRYGYNRTIGGDGVGKGKESVWYGKHHTLEARKLCKIKNIGKHNGDKSPLAKKYKIIKPSGEIEIITGLSEFCKKNELPFFSALYLIKTGMKGIKGKLKGYIIVDAKNPKINERKIRYKITEPDGNILYVSNLTNYAEKHNLNRDTLYNMCRLNIRRDYGKYKGYVFERINLNE